MTTTNPREAREEREKIVRKESEKGEAEK